MIASKTGIENSARTRTAGSSRLGPIRIRRAAPWLLLAIYSLMTFSATAQECPGANTTATANFYGMGSAGVGMGAGMVLFDFIGSGGCTYAKFGNPTMQPTMCTIERTEFVTLVSMFAAVLRAQFATGDAATTVGCTFMCDGGTCQTRGIDGLPVELLQFEIGAE